MPVRIDALRFSFVWFSTVMIPLGDLTCGREELFNVQCDGVDADDRRAVSV